MHTYGLHIVITNRPGLSTLPMEGLRMEPPPLQQKDAWKLSPKPQTLSLGELHHVKSP